MAEVITTSLVPIEGQAFTQEEIAAFEQKYLEVCKNLSNMVKQKKQIEEQESKVKEQLAKVMDEFGIKSMDNAFIRFTRVAANPGKQTIDIDKMRNEEPELYAELLADYPKTTGAKKAYVKFETK